MRPAPAALFVCTALLAPATASAFVRSHVTDHPETYLYWPSRTVSVVLHQQGSQDVSRGAMRAAVLESLTEWSANECTDFLLTWGGTTPNRATNLVGSTKPDHQNTLVWREDDWPDDVGASVLALTTLVYDTSSGAILDGDIDFNGEAFFWTATDDDNAIVTDVQNTVTHELGHLLGLDHSPDPESTMFGATEARDIAKRTLGADDLAGLCFMYPAGDSSELGTLESDPSAITLEGSSCRSVPGGASGWTWPLLLAAFFALGRRRSR